MENIKASIERNNNVNLLNIVWTDPSKNSTNLPNKIRLAQIMNGMPTKTNKIAPTIVQNI